MENDVMENQDVFFNSRLLAVLKEQMRLSPHTVLLMNSPVHAYLCEGDACRARVNATEETPGE